MDYKKNVDPSSPPIKNHALRNLALDAKLSHYHVIFSRLAEDKIHGHRNHAEFRNLLSIPSRPSPPWRRSLNHDFMDAAAYLVSQGWAGHGHALHHSGRGITKPIAVAQKNNVLGIGKKKHDAHADQWWARAFDETLKGINTQRDQDTVRAERIQFGAETKEPGRRIKGGPDKGLNGLYSCFIRGEGLSGTLTPDEMGVEPNESERNEAKEPNGSEAQFVSKRKMKKSKKTKHLGVEIHHPEVPITKRLAHIQRKDDSDPRGGEQAVKDPPQIQGFTAINHNPDMSVVKSWPEAGEERKEQQRQKRREHRERKRLLTWQPLGVDSIEPSKDWLAAQQRLQEKQVWQIERQQRSEAKKAKMWERALRPPRKLLTAEEKKARNIRENDRHKAIRTP